MKTFIFYLRYYLNNNWISRIPIHWFRIWWYRRIMKIQIGEGTNIQMNVLFYGDFIHRISIGKGSVIHPRCVFNAAESITLGDGVQLGHAVEFYTGGHDPLTENWAGVRAPISVGNGVLITSKSTILSGVTIGEGACVTPGSVVAKSVEPYTIVGGVPARLIQKRPVQSVKIQSLGRPPLFC